MGKFDNLSDTEKRKKIEELKLKIQSVKNEFDFYKAMNLGLKVVLNGTYGAFCHPAFTASNTNIANAITSMSRDIINYMLDNIEDYFYNKWHNDKEVHDLLGVVYLSEKDNKYFYHKKNGDLIDKFGRNKIDKNGDNTLDGVLQVYALSRKDIVDNDKEFFNINNEKYNVVHKLFICDFSNIIPIPSDYKVKPDTNSKDFEISRGVRKNPLIIAGDTDSSHKNTLIYTDKNTCTIEELYNKNINNGSAGNTLKGHESVYCEDNILNWCNDKKLYFAPPKRIIRHKVTKEKWKLKTKTGKEIIITNDHSLIVFRNNIQLEIKPKDVLKTDKILIIKNNGI